VEKDIDDAKLLAVLHSLYSITFAPPGRDAVVTVMALDDNIAVLLPFIEMNGALFITVSSLLCHIDSRFVFHI